MIEADWSQFYSRLLADDFRSMRARQFDVLVKGLLFEPNSRIARMFSAGEGASNGG